MSGSVAAVTRSWRVGTRTVTLTLPQPVAGEARAAVIEWSPARPLRLSPAKREQYRDGRTAAIAELSKAIGLRIAVVEA